MTNVRMKVGTLANAGTRTSGNTPYMGTSGYFGTPVGTPTSRN